MVKKLSSVLGERRTRLTERIGIVKARCLPSAGKLILDARGRVPLLRKTCGKS